MNDIQPWECFEPLKAEVEPIAVGLLDCPDPEPEVWRPGYTSIQPDERRASHRYPALGDGGRSWLGWYEWSNFRQVAAWILNISSGGCLLAADAPAPHDRAIWLRLDNAAVPDWAEVRVIAHQRTNAGLLATRLAFRSSCPYDVMKAVAFGPAHQLTGPEAKTNLCCVKAPGLPAEASPRHDRS
jgi:hypothetical protein